jgi:hypothetical protein
MICLSFFALLQNFAPKRKFGLSVLDILIALFCLTYFASTILSADIMGSGRLAFRFIFIPVISYFTVKSLVTSEKEYETAVFSLIGSIVLFAIIALLTVGLTGLRQVAMGMPSIVTATLAAFAICTLFFSGWWRKGLGFSALMPVLALLAMTLPRAYIVGLLASPIVYRGIRKGFALKLCLTFFIVSIALTMFLTFNPSFVKTKSQEIEGRRSIERVINPDLWQQSLYGRAFSYREGIQNFKEHFLFGTGLQIGEFNITRHNFHIEWLEYGGVVGYSIYLLFFVAYYATHTELAKRDVFCAVNLLIVMLILLNSLTNGIMHGLMPHLAFITIGLGEARRKIMEQDSTRLG